MKKSFEFICSEKKMFIKDISVYNGVSFEVKENWNNKNKFYRITLYYYTVYDKTGGCLSFDTEEEYFDFYIEENAIDVYEKLKSLLGGNNE